jgi:hypothetical protein
VDDENVDVTPAGNPETLRATVPENPPELAKLTTF